MSESMATVSYVSRVTRNDLSKVNQMVIWPLKTNLAGPWSQMFV